MNRPGRSGGRPLTGEGASATPASHRSRAVPAACQRYPRIREGESDAAELLRPELPQSRERPTPTAEDLAREARSRSVGRATGADPSRLVRAIPAETRRREREDGSGDHLVANAIARHEAAG